MNTTNRYFGGLVAVYSSIHPVQAFDVSVCCVCLKLLGPVTPVLDALVTPRGYTVAAQVAPRRRVWE